MKKIAYLFVAFGLVLTLSGCSSEPVKEAEETVETTAENAKDFFKEETEKAVSDVEKAGTISKEEVEKAVTFLNEHVVKDAKDVSEDTWKEITYYASWLKEAAKKDAGAAEHEIAALANHAHDWASVAWAKTTDGIEGTEEEIKEKVVAAAETVKKDVSGLVEKFTSFFNK